MATTPIRCAAIRCSSWRSIACPRARNCVRNRPFRGWKTCRTCGRCCASGGRWSSSIAARFEPFQSIVGNHLLVPLELAPGDIALVLILEQHVPFGQWAPHAATDALAAVLDAYLAHRAAKGISASIDGVGQDVVDRVVERQPPGDAAPSAAL